MVLIKLIEETLAGTLEEDCKSKMMSDTMNETGRCYCGYMKTYSESLVNLLVLSESKGLASRYRDSHPDEAHHLVRSFRQDHWRRKASHQVP